MKSMLISLNAALVLLGIAVICDANKQQVISILGNFGRVLFALDLFNGGINSLVVFQLDDDDRLIHVLTG